MAAGHLRRAASDAVLPPVRRQGPAGHPGVDCRRAGQQDVNLDAVFQEPGYPKDRLPFVITVEPCEEAALLEALGELNEADWHAEPPLALPMLLWVRIRDIVFISCHLPKKGPRAKAAD